MAECSHCGISYSERIDRCPSCGLLLENTNLMVVAPRRRAMGVYQNLGHRAGGRGNMDPGNFRFSECPSCRGMMRHGRAPVSVGGVWLAEEIENSWFCDACGFTGPR
jgi:hypothetical protein